jgi:TPR repeat protein
MAADQRYAKAQSVLGKMYASGQGVSQNYAEALKWYQLAADQHDAEGQFGLGELLENGRGVLQDYAAAARWYQRAADQDLAEAQDSLGHMYEAGHGVPQDYVQAQKWFNLAASEFTSLDKKPLSAAVADRDRVAAKMTPAQIADAQKLAREWKPTGTP